MRQADRSLARGLLVSLWGASYALGIDPFTAFGIELSKCLQMPSKPRGLQPGFGAVIGVPGSITAVLLAVAFGRRAAVVTLATTAVAITALLLLDVLFACMLAPLIWLVLLSVGLAASTRPAPPITAATRADTT